MSKGGDMSIEELRRWAIEQVISHHSGNGRVLEHVIADAEKLIEYVLKRPAEAK